MDKKLKYFVYSQNSLNTYKSCPFKFKYKYIDNINNRLKEELEEPSDDFVRFMINNFYDGVKNKNVVDRFRPIVKKALSQFATDFMNEKIQIALGENALTTSNITKNNIEKETSKVLTKEELDALETIREILSDVVNKEDITYKSTKSYFGINYKNNTNNWICRLFLYRKNKMGIHIPNENKESIKYDFDEISDLKEIKDILEEVVKRYI